MQIKSQSLGLPYIGGSPSAAYDMELRILTWLFPWVMSLLEFLLRASAGHTDAWDFIGPTVGAAALGMMLPLTQASMKTTRQIWRREKSGRIVRDMDRLAPWVNIAVWIGLTAWATSVYLSVNQGSPYAPQIDGARTSLLIGFILWLCAVVVDLARGGK